MHAGDNGGSIGTAGERAGGRVVLGYFCSQSCCRMRAREEQRYQQLVAAAAPASAPRAGDLHATAALHHHRAEEHRGEGGARPGQAGALTNTGEWG